MSRLGGFPFEPLAALLPDGPDQHVADLVGVSRRTVIRWKAGQHLDRWAADRAAIRLGTHPALVWPTWTDPDLALEAS